MNDQFMCLTRDLCSNPLQKGGNYKSKVFLRIVWVIENYWNLNWRIFLWQWDDNWLCCMHMKVTILISSFQDHLSSSSLILHFLIRSIITLMYSDFLVRKLTSNDYVIEGHKKAEGHFFSGLRKLWWWSDQTFFEVICHHLGVAWFVWW